MPDPIYVQHPQQPQAQGSNPFFVKPMSPLSGLNAFSQGVTSRVDLEMEKAYAQKMQEKRDELAGLHQTGTPDEIADYIIKNPELAKDLEKADEISGKMKKEESIKSAWDIYTGKVPPAQGMQDRAKKILERGGDAAHSLKIAEQAMIDEEVGKKAAAAVLARLDPEAFKAYNKAHGIGGEVDGDKKAYSPTGEDRYVEDKGNEWLANNPSETEVPAGLGAGWRLEHKRAQAGELAAGATAKKTAELEVIKKMQPGIERDKAIATYQAKAEESRGQKIINDGLLSAESIPNLKRGIELLETVTTGGFSNISLATKRFFGAEGADEGELSYRLSKKVLQQLRDTFGAAFTAEEKRSLERIESNFSKSPSSNKRLLNQALRMSNRKVAAARKYATKNGDTATIEELDDWANFNLSLDEEGQDTPPSAEVTAPPVPGAKKAPDGKWYVEENGKFFRVE